MKIFLLTIGTFIGLSLVASALNLVTIPWLKFDRQVQMERDITERTYNAENALYNYRWFKDKYEEIKATEKKIDNAQMAIDQFEESAGERSDWTFEDKQEHARLNTVLLGLKNHYQTIVGEYNSRAKQADRNIFQDELPLFFSIKPY